MEKINSKQILFLGTEDTVMKLDFLAKSTERSRAGWLRWIIEREYEQHSPTRDNGNQSDGEE